MVQTYFDLLVGCNVTSCPVVFVADNARGHRALLGNRRKGFLKCESEPVLSNPPKAMVRNRQMKDGRHILLRGASDPKIPNSHSRTRLQRRDSFDGEFEASRRSSIRNASRPRRRSSIDEKMSTSHTFSIYKADDCQKGNASKPSRRSSFNLQDIAAEIVACRRKINSSGDFVQQNLDPERCSEFICNVLSDVNLLEDNGFKQSRSLEAAPDEAVVY